MEDFNQDVIESCTDSIMEIATATNFILPSNTDITSDVSNVIMDEWFKPRNESVSEMDFDKNEGMDSNYLDALGYHFLLPKDSVDMCVVTNVSEMGLGLELSLNTCDKSKLGTFVSVNEKDCATRILNDFRDQNPLLGDLCRSDILDKDMLVEDDNHEMTTGDKFNLHHSSVKDKQETLSINCVLENNEENFAHDASIKVKEEVKDKCNGIISTDTLSLNNRDKVNWESFIISRPTVDFDSEKEVDFPEFNLLTFQVDPSNGMNVVSSLPHIEYCDKELHTTCDMSEDTRTVDSLNICETCEIPGTSKVLVTETTSISQAYNIDVFADKEIINDSSTSDVPALDNTSSKSPLVDTSNVETPQKLITCENQVPNDNGSSPNAPEQVVKSKPIVYVRPTNPRSVLKTPLRNIIQSKNIITQKHVNSNNTLKKTLSSCGILTNVNAGQENLKSGPKRKSTPPSVAIIAISTNKSKNTTEIVINTPHGEQKFKGKTSDLMKATSNIWNKLDNSSVKMKPEQQQPLDIAEVDETPATTLENEDFSPWLRNDLSRTAAVEQPITEALAQLGVDVDGLTSMINSKGQKLWTCLNKDCNKIFPRLSMLKVHILTHYGVRPYRCDYVGCHWTFYTYFKLKRHRETHLKRKLFICPVANCERRFTTVYNLNTHQKLHDRPAEMVCPVESCHARFQTKRSMELHMKKHDSSHAPYKCSFEGCGKHYYSANSLNSHVRSHQHKEEEVRCQWEGCGKLFDKPCRLKAHMRTHTGDKPYPCKFKDCGWAFSSASKLKRHQHKHTNERRFRCSFEGCNKSFMRSEHLKEHTLTHIGERTFHCTVENCNVKFSAKSSLYVHLKKHNHAKQQLQQSSTEKVMYRCQVEMCNRNYNSKGSLRQHMLLAHTPVESSPRSFIDYSELIPGEEDLVMLHSLQLPSDLTPATSGGILNSSGLLAPSTMLSNGEGMCTLNSEYLNTDLQLQSVLGTDITPPQDPQNNSFLLNQNDSESGDQNNLPLLDMQTEEISDEDLTCGSARTKYTYQDIVRIRERKHGVNLESTFPQVAEPPALRLPTDVVLGIGMLGNTSDITNSLLLQDDHDPGIPGVSEFQVLLLDPGGSTQEFSESTINLRDLE